MSLVWIKILGPLHKNFRRSKLPKVGTPRSSPRGGYIQLYYATMTTVKLKIKLADYQLVDTLHQSWSVAVTVAKVSFRVVNGLDYNLLAVT